MIVARKLNKPKEKGRKKMIEIRDETKKREVAKPKK